MRRNTWLKAGSGGNFLRLSRLSFTWCVFHLLGGLDASRFAKDGAC